LEVLFLSSGKKNWRIIFLMEKFSFKEANLLDWSNEYLDFVIASKLLVLVYEERPESNHFWNSLDEIQKKCINATGDFNKLSNIFQNFLPVGPIGGSRQQTQNSMASFFNVLTPTAFQAASLTKNLSWAVSLSSDPLMIDTMNDYEEFCHTYESYLKNRLGGTWVPTRSNLKISYNPKNANHSFLLRHGNKSTYNPFLDKRVENCLEYWQNLVHLYYEFGLKCWWAPFIQFMTDLSIWAGKINTEEQPTPTVDGMLGPVFSRIYVNTGTVIEGLRRKELSVHNYHEYLLLAMSRNDMRKRIGQDNEPVIHKQMEEWGYKHGNRWDCTDFNMLFDRLYLKNRIEDIADKYQTNESSVQRRTARLAHILDLTLTKAPHKEHRHS
jgi:hypothetical protein